MSRGRRPTGLVLRSGDEIEESLKVDWRPVFAEDEGRGGAGNSHLVRVSWVIVGTLWSGRLESWMIWLVSGCVLAGDLRYIWS